MVIVLFALTTIFVLLWLMSRRRYAGCIEMLDKKRYPLKQFIPAGMFLLDIVGYGFNSGYDRRLLTKLAELYGLKGARQYLKVHWANKLVYLFVGLLLALLVGTKAGIDPGLFIFGVLLLAGIFYLPDRELDNLVKNRRAEIRRDFPDFLSKLTLLINAGLTVSKAWEKAVLDSKKDGLLYKELAGTLSGIKMGKPEHKAYEDFARRCKIPEVSRFVSVILQNLRKGNSELVSLLRVYSSECWEMRKNEAKRLGEEASTKLLLPMTLMFIAILLIVVTPAVLALRGI